MMKNTLPAHTPGPWFVDEFNNLSYFFVSQRRNQGDEDTLCQVYKYAEEGDGAANAHLIATAPEMREAIETLRCLLIKATSGNSSVHDDGAFQDAIARSGHLLLRAQGTDTTDIVARYEASLLESPEDDDTADDDFGRYGRHDD